jgi:hypothetical protein
VPSVRGNVCVALRARACVCVCVCVCAIEVTCCVRATAAWMSFERERIETMLLADENIGAVVNVLK